MTSLNGKERRQLRHLIKKENKIILEYLRQDLNINGVRRTPETHGMSKRYNMLADILNKLERKD